MLRKHGSQGSSGCHNERLGGDTVIVEKDLSGPYFTYIVSRSFRIPPHRRG